MPTDTSSPTPYGWLGRARRDEDESSGSEHRAVRAKPQPKRLDVEVTGRATGRAADSPSTSGCGYVTGDPLHSCDNVAYATCYDTHKTLYFREGDTFTEGVSYMPQIQDLRPK